MELSGHYYTVFDAAASVGGHGVCVYSFHHEDGRPCNENNFQPGTK
jgi:hypothetical protein